MPGENVPVRFLSLPIAMGPTNPPRFPTELIRPMLPAAAASVRKRLGNDQKAGR